MLTIEEARSLVEHIRQQSEIPAAIDAEAVEELLRRPHDPNGLWHAIRNGVPLEWRYEPVSLQTMAALLFELAASCPGTPSGEHRLCRVGTNNHDACQWCGLRGDVARSLAAWTPRQEALR